MTLQPPDLRTDDFFLRPWQPEDLDALVAALRDSDIPRWTRIPEPYSHDEGRDFLKRSSAAWADGTGASFAIVGPTGAALLGSIGVRFHTETAASVGYWVAREARGRDIASQALLLVAGWVLRALPVERLELVTDPENRASQRVAEKAGFTREGLLRRYLEIKGVRRDCVVFSLLREELR